MIARLFMLWAAVFMTGCATVSTRRPPSITLDIPTAFNHSVELKHFNTGEELWEGPPQSKKAQYPVTRYAGAWGKQNSPNQREHGWSVEVALASAAKIQQVHKAHAEATDGYDAGHRVDEDGSYMFARFARKDFRWGKAFCYLTQFTQDTSVYVPHNGHLTYEVWGVTHDGTYMVHASFELTHPKLASWGPEVRVADSIAALKKDRDYLLVESCSPGAFEPGLTVIDAWLNSLQVK